MSLAVQDLHKFNIVHCDLKPDNMLFIGDSVKLIDYNASLEMDKEVEIQGPCEQGTPGYMAEEMYNGWVSYKADIYSLGISMLVVYFGDIWATDSGDYNKNRKTVLDYLFNLKKDNFDLYNIVNKCVTPEPKKRPSIQKVVSSLDRIQQAQAQHSEKETSV